jgi:hypothetical protein
MSLKPDGTPFKLLCLMSWARKCSLSMRSCWISCRNCCSLMNVCRTHSRAFSTMRLLEGRRSSCRLGNACASCWNLTFKDSLLARSIALCSALRSAFPVLNGRKKIMCEKKLKLPWGDGTSYREEELLSCSLLSRGGHANGWGGHLHIEWRSSSDA